MSDLTSRQYRQFHYGIDRLLNPKKKPMSYSLVDGSGKVYITGAYSLCVWKQKKVDIPTSIRPNYE